MKRNPCSIIFVMCLGMLLWGCSSPGVYVKGNVVKSGFNFRDEFSPAQLKQLHADFKKGSFAILPFESAASGKQFTDRIATDGNAVADLLSIQMMFHGFNVLDREKISTVFEEKSMSMSGITNTEGEGQNAEKLAEIGKILGVDYIIYGSVIQYHYAPGRWSDWQLSLGITAKIIAVKDAKILLAMSGETVGNNLSDALDGTSIAFTDLLRKERVYEWQR